MSVEANISPDGAQVTISLPVQFRKRGGRKQVVVPDGHCSPPVTRSQVDSTLVKAIARAHRWQRMLESGDYASIAELASAERINPSYLARVLRLTLLAPNLVDRILDGQAPEVTLGWLLKTVPTDCERQARRDALWSIGETSNLRGGQVQLAPKSVIEAEFPAAENGPPFSRRIAVPEIGPSRRPECLL
jgi:hypothetical protein